MKDRLKELRKDLGYTQQDFADRLGIKRTTIGNYEVGRNEPVDSVIALICDRFGVSEKWLRTGEGEMYVETKKDDDIDRLISDMLNDETAEMKKRLITAILRLSPGQIDKGRAWMKETFELSSTAADQADTTAAGQSTTTADRADTTAAEQSTTTAAPDAPDINVGEMTIDEKVESYRQELLAVEQAKKRDGEVTA